ncbi:hypothetical protein NQZ68_027476 [Dissostichus eleginoides]|nr:hypothetical protein NQZ68_027476 [Dissostichus eleginoides]
MCCLPFPAHTFGFRSQDQNAKSALYLALLCRLSLRLPHMSLKQGHQVRHGWLLTFTLSAFYHSRGVIVLLFTIGLLLLDI